MKNQRVHGWLIVSLAALLLLTPGAGCQKELTPPQSIRYYSMTGQLLHHHENGVNYPVEDARVSLGSNSTYSRHNGFFTFNQIREGNYTFQAEMSGYETLEQEVSINASPSGIVVFWMRKTSTETRDISGQVFFTVNQVHYSVEDAHVTIAEKTDDTDTYGQFTVVGVPYGQQQMRVVREGFTTVEQSLDVNQTTPASVTVPLEPADEDTVPVVNEEVNLTFVINQCLLNTEPLENPSAEVACRRILRHLEQVSGGVSKVIRVAGPFNPNILTMGFWKFPTVTITLSQVVGLPALLAAYQNNFVRPDENVHYVYEVAKSDNEHYFLIIPYDEPIYSIVNALEQGEYEYLLRDYDIFPEDIRTPEELRDNLYSTILARVSQGCALYGIAVIGSILPASTLVFIGCGGVGALRIAQAVTEITEEQYEDGIWKLCVRKASFEGPPTRPFICILKKPTPNPPPFVELSVEPSTYTIKLSDEPKQFRARAEDSQGMGSNVTDIVSWSLEGITGQIQGGLFTPIQVGSGFAVASLRPQWDLDARASVTVRPANRPPSCSFTTVMRTPTDDLAYWVSGRVTDPDQDRFDDIAVDFDDGEIIHLTNDGLNQLGEFTITHRFPNFDDYNLHLKVTDVDGAECNSTYPLHISPPPNEPPVSHQSCPARVTVGQPFTVTNNATDADGTVTEYRFRTNYQEIITPQKTITLTFSTPGFEQVCMSARDDDGEWGEGVCCEIEVVRSNQPPTVTPITPTQLTKTAGEVFTIEWQGSDPDPGDTIQKYQIRDSVNQPWQDHHATSAQLRYDNAGIYWFEARAVDNHGSAGPAFRWNIAIDVNNLPMIDPETPSPVYGNVGDGITIWFSAHDPDPGDTVVWKEYRSFFDQIWRRDSGPERGGWYHRYTEPGSFWFEARAIDSHNETGQTYRWTIIIENQIDPLAISFTLCPSSARPGEPVHFEVSVTGGVPPYRVRWQPLGEDPITNSNLTFDWTFDAPMSTYLTATALDSRDVESTLARCNLEIDTGVPSVSCSLSPNPAETNEDATATAVGSDDDTDWNQVQVRWQKEAAANWTQWTYTKNDTWSYPTIGLKTVTVEAKDRWNRVSSSTCTVQVEEPQPITGTIVVTATQVATFHLTGAATRSGTTPATLTDMPPGSYTDSFDPLADHCTPDPETKWLAAGETITFHGVFPDCPTQVQITSLCPGPYALTGWVNTWLTATGGGQGSSIIWEWGGNPPPGLTLFSDGHLTGDPNVLGAFSVTIHAYDSQYHSNDDYQDCTIEIIQDEAVINVWPPSLDFETAVEQRDFYVERVSGPSPIHFTVTSNNTRATTHPTSGYTNTHVNVSVDRDGQAPGNYQATITVTPDGGEPKTVTAYWAVGCNDYYPEIIGPANGETVSIRNLTFAWTCYTAPCRNLQIEIYEDPYDPAPILSDNNPCEDLSWYYNHDYWNRLEPYRTYYWWICIEPPNGPINWCSTIPLPTRSFRTTP